MNHHTNPHESEWQAQERAREQARAGGSRSIGAVPHADLLVAQALRSAPLPALPPDFARDVARLAAAAPARTEDSNDSPLEQTLTAALGLTLGVAGMLTAAHYGADWWQASASMLPEGSAAGWVAVAAACLGMSWLTGWLKPLR